MNVAKEIQAVTQLIAGPKDLLRYTNVGADKHLKKDVDNLFRAFVSMRSALG